jgi:formylglycine-generating enzyme required for sulfatase activity
MGAQKQDKKGHNYDPEADDGESPVHEVTLRAFRIGRFPVTVQEFGTFISAGRILGAEILGGRVWRVSGAQVLGAAETVSESAGGGRQLV